MRYARQPLRRLRSALTDKAICNILGESLHSSTTLFRVNVCAHTHYRALEGLREMT